MVSLKKLINILAFWVACVRRSMVALTLNFWTILLTEMKRYGNVKMWTDKAILLFHFWAKKVEIKQEFYFLLCGKNRITSVQPEIVSLHYKMKKKNINKVLNMQFKPFFLFYLTISTKNVKPAARIPGKNWLPDGTS